MQADALRTAEIKVIAIIVMNAPALLSSGVFTCTCYNLMTGAW